MGMDFNLSFLILILTTYASYQAFENSELKAKMLFIPYRIKRTDEKYRFISKGFIHADWMHLVFNMYALYLFGGAVEQYFGAVFGTMMGPVFYLLLYFIGLVAASLPTYLKEQDNYGYSALGASGAVSGVVFAYIIFAPWNWLFLFFVIPMPAVVAGIAYLAYSHYMGKKNVDNIGHDAHFYGSIFGFLFTIVAIALYRPELFNLLLESFMAGPDFSALSRRGGFNGW